MSSLAADLRDAVRALRRNPAFTIVAILTIALGMGANTAVFSVMNAVLLRPLPYNDPGRLVWVAKVEPAMHAEIAAGADYLNWRDQARSLGAIAAWDEAPGLTLLGAGDPERLVGAHVSASFLPLLGVAPARGRGFAPPEERLGAAPVAIVSDRLWQRLYGPGETFRERPLHLDAGVFTIVGVLPRSFLFPQMPAPDVLLPLRLDEATERQRQMMSIVHVIGRLGAGSTIPQARSELTAIWRRGEQRARVASEPRLDPDVGSTAPEGTAPDVAGAPSSDSFDIPIGAPAPATGVDQRVRLFEHRDAADVSGGGTFDGPTGAAAAPPGEDQRVRPLRRPGAGDGSPAGPLPAPAGAGDVLVRPLHEHLVGDIRPALLLLTATVGLVLLIACANVANLVLARATARARELAVRATLGATRWRLVRQVLVESLLLSLMGGSTGLLVANWGLGAVRTVMPPSLAQGALGVTPIGIDRGVLAFTFAVAAVTGLLFGIGPALLASRHDLESSLKESSRSAAGSVGRNRLRRTMVAGEIALAVVLLVGAGLLVRSFARLLAVDPGFRPEQVVTMAVNLREPLENGVAQQASSFFADVADRVRSLPGVQVVAYGDTVPLREYSRIMMGLGIDGRAEIATAGPPPEVAISMVSPDYFAAMGVRLVRGRVFTEDDRHGAPAVAIVNERFARQFLGPEDPIGRRIRFGPRQHDWITVIGVVADVRHEELAADARRTMYRPFDQEPVPFGFVVVRTTGEPAPVVQSVRQVIRTIDPSLAVYDVATMGQRVERSVGGRRLSMLLMLAFAVVALLLAAVGLYGVLAFIVGERTREIGIRMALGAEARDVLALVMRQSGAMVLVGIAVGLAGALAAGPLLASALYAVTPLDRTTLAGVPLLIAAVAAVATWLPARRATRVNPVEALREG